MVNSVAFSPDGQLILTASWDRTARLWKSNTRTLHAILQGHTHSVESAAFSPDGQMVLTGSIDKTARLWDCQTGQLQVILQGHTRSVESVTFSPDGQLVLTGSADGRLALTSDSRGWTFFWQIQKLDALRLRGLYVTVDSVSSLFWQDATHLLLADPGAGSGHPFIYHLQLQGPCWQAAKIP